MPLRRAYEYDVVRRVRAWLRRRAGADASPAQVARSELLGKRCRGLASRWPQLAAGAQRTRSATPLALTPLSADLLALLTGLKPAVMMDYWFERCGAPGEALASVGQLILELRALYAGACPEIAELRCLQLGDCVFLLRPSLQSARRDAGAPVRVPRGGASALRPASGATHRVSGLAQRQQSDRRERAACTAAALRPRRHEGSLRGGGGGRVHAGASLSYGALFPIFSLLPVTHGG
jgi:hypothetical protein